MYLLRRGALFHFSRKLPDAFQGQNLNLASGPRKVGGNGYLRFSLGTGNRREAERLARRYAVEVDEALQAETASMHREIPLPTLRSHQAFYGTTGHRQDPADGLDP